MSRSRNWCFTLNNYTAEEEKLIKDVECRFIIYGKEIGEKTNNRHLQGYIQFTNARTLTAVKRSISKRAHLEVARGSSEDNVAYCSKQDKEPFTKGDIKKQGKRTDLEDVKEMITDGATMRDIIPSCNSIQSVRMAEITLKYFERKRNTKPYVEWYFGATGTGKSKTAYEKLDDPYTCLDTISWWEGYDAHEHVLIDDIRKDFAKYHQLLKLLDRYPYIVECKGGSRQFLATHIIITSPFHPKELYHTREDIQQLLRRIDNIKEFKDKLP